MIRALIFETQDSPFALGAKSFQTPSVPIDKSYIHSELPFAKKVFKEAWWWIFSTMFQEKNHPDLSGIIKRDYHFLWGSKLIAHVDGDFEGFPHPKREFFFGIEFHPMVTTSCWDALKIAPRINFHQVNLNPLKPAVFGSRSPKNAMHFSVFNTS